jgi:GNAT superfamily N-acetyltransferase
MRPMAVAPTVVLMQTRYVDGVTIRVLRNGEAGPVAALLARLTMPSPKLELTELARVDGDHHVLIAYIDGDPRPGGIARLVRDGSSADVSLAVADERHGRRVAAALSQALAADARAAGIRDIRRRLSGAGRPKPVGILERIRQHQGLFAGRDALKGARIAVASPWDEGCEDRLHGLLVPLPRGSGSAVPMRDG